MSKTITVEGDVNAIDTLVRLTGQGSVTAPSLVVPAGMKKIKALLATAGADGLAAGQAVMLVRLGGAAVLNGEQTIIIGGQCSQTVQAGSDAAPSIHTAFMIDDLDVDVNPSDTISISGEMAGVDVGDTTMAVTLIYSE